MMGTSFPFGPLRSSGHGRKQKARAIAGACLGGELSRQRIGLLFVLYFLAAVVFTAFEASLEPFTKFDSGKIGEVIGGGIAIYVMAGILPMLFWAFQRFKPERAGGPFVAWLIVAVPLAYFTDFQDRYDRNLKITEFTNKSVFEGKDRTDFVKMFRLSCIQNQTSNPLTPKLGVTAQFIAGYCDCMAGGMAEATTMEELKYAVRTGQLPSSMNDKALMIAPNCSKAAFKK
jgi:hypothetical protein